jgi:hypothetical protein
VGYGLESPLGFLQERDQALYLGRVREGLFYQGLTEGKHSFQPLRTGWAQAQIHDPAIFAIPPAFHQTFGLQPVNQGGYAAWADKELFLQFAHGQGAVRGQMQQYPEAGQG